MGDYKALFVSKDGIKPIAHSLLEIIKEDQVLKPNLNDFFNFSSIELQFLKANKKDIKELIKADFMLLTVYHQYMSYLSRGIMDWKQFQKKLKSLDEEKEIIANWRKYRVRKSFRKLLYKSIEENDINLAINEVNYTFPKAKELSELIKRYEEIANKGGYTKVPSVTKSMKKGNFYPQIKFLRQRLIESNDLKENNCSEKEDLNTNNLFKAEPQ